MLNTIEFVWETYSAWSDRTAEYPAQHAYEYLTLGLISEVLEHFEEPSLDELGDICWYLAQLSLRLGFTYDFTVPPNFGRHDLSFQLKILTSIASIAKKQIRDDSLHLDDALIESLQDLFYWVLSFDTWSVCMALQNNYDKLSYRKRNKTIKAVIHNDDEPTRWDATEGEPSFSFNRT